MNLTRPQRESLRRVYLHQHDDEKRKQLPYREFRRRISPMFGDNGIMVCIEHINLWIGIEVDGYAHS